MQAKNGQQNTKSFHVTPNVTAYSIEASENVQIGNTHKSAQKSEKVTHETKKDFYDQIHKSILDTFKKANNLTDDSQIADFVKQSTQSNEKPVKSKVLDLVKGRNNNQENAPQKLMNESLLLNFSTTTYYEKDRYKSSDYSSYNATVENCAIPEIPITDFSVQGLKQSASLTSPRYLSLLDRRNELNHAFNDRVKVIGDMFFAEQRADHFHGKTSLFPTLDNAQKGTLDSNSKDVKNYQDYENKVNVLQDKLASLYKSIGIETKEQEMQRLYKTQLTKVLSATDTLEDFEKAQAQNPNGYSQAEEYQDSVNLRNNMIAYKKDLATFLNKDEKDFETPYEKAIKETLQSENSLGRKPPHDLNAPLEKLPVVLLSDLDISVSELSKSLYEFDIAQFDNQNGSEKHNAFHKFSLENAPDGKNPLAKAISELAVYATNGIDKTIEERKRHKQALTQETQNLKGYGTMPDKDVLAIGQNIINASEKTLSKLDLDPDQLQEYHENVLKAFSVNSQDYASAFSVQRQSINLKPFIANMEKAYSHDVNATWKELALLADDTLSSLSKLSPKLKDQLNADGLAQNGITKISTLGSILGLQASNDREILQHQVLAQILTGESKPHSNSPSRHDENLLVKAGLLSNTDFAKAKEYTNLGASSPLWRTYLNFDNKAQSPFGAKLDELEPFISDNHKDSYQAEFDKKPPLVTFLTNGDRRKALTGRNILNSYLDSIGTNLYTGVHPHAKEKAQDGTPLEPSDKHHVKVVSVSANIAKGHVLELDYSNANPKALIEVTRGTNTLFVREFERSLLNLDDGLTFSLTTEQKNASTTNKDTIKSELVGLGSTEAQVMTRIMQTTLSLTPVLTGNYIISCKHEGKNGLDTIKPLQMTSLLSQNTGGINMATTPLQQLGSQNYLPISGRTNDHASNQGLVKPLTIAYQGYERDQHGDITLTSRYDNTSQMDVYTLSSAKTQIFNSYEQAEKAIVDDHLKSIDNAPQVVLPANYDTESEVRHQLLESDNITNILKDPILQDDLKQKGIDSTVTGEISAQTKDEIFSFKDGYQELAFEKQKNTLDDLKDIIERYNQLLLKQSQIAENVGKMLNAELDQEKNNLE